jgi:hypothetical protein
MPCRFRQSFVVYKITLVGMSNLRSFNVDKYYKKTTKTDKDVLVIFPDKARRFVKYFYEGFSQLRINLPTRVCRFRQSFVVSDVCFVVSDKCFVGKS